MKKLVALLLACMMLLTAGVAMAEETDASESAYNAITPNGNYGLDHILTIDDELPYNITYSFDVKGPEVVKPEVTDNNTIEKMVVGSPDIAPIVYEAGKEVPADRKITTPLTIDWESVSIKEPGVYRWEVQKSKSFEGAGAPPSNDRENNYLYVYVVNDDQAAVGLKVEEVLLVAKDTETIKGDINDQYPAKTLDLTIGKQVSGNLASKNQYFQFSLTLTPPSGAANKTYTISGIESTIPETVYNSSATNTISFDATGGTPKTVTFWLKHDDTATISDLLYGTTYYIKEIVSEDFEVSYVKQVDGLPYKPMNGSEITGSNLEKSTIITFTNKKDIPVPTGIDLQTGAPIMGLLLAAAMMLMLNIGKRKEAAE